MSRLKRLWSLVDDLHEARSDISEQVVRLRRFEEFLCDRIERIELRLKLLEVEREMAAKRATMERQEKFETAKTGEWINGAARGSNRIPNP